MKSENIVCCASAANGGVILTQGDAKLQLTSAQVSQATDLLRQDERGILNFREHPLRRTPGERVAGDVVVQLGVEGEVRMDQVVNGLLTTVSVPIAGMREWFRAESADTDR